MYVRPLVVLGAAFRRCFLLLDADQRPPGAVLESACSEYVRAWPSSVRYCAEPRMPDYRV